MKRDDNQEHKYFSEVRALTLDGRSGHLPISLWFFYLQPLHFLWLRCIEVQDSGLVPTDPLPAGHNGSDLQLFGIQYRVVYINRHLCDQRD